MRISPKTNKGTWAAPKGKRLIAFVVLVFTLVSNSPISALAADSGEMLLDVACPAVTEYTVESGTELSSIGLPAELAVTVETSEDDGESETRIENVPVQWTGSYNSKEAGDYVLTAEFADQQLSYSPMPCVTVLVREPVVEQAVITEDVAENGQNNENTDAAELPLETTVQEDEKAANNAMISPVGVTDEISVRLTEEANPEEDNTNDIPEPSISPENTQELTQDSKTQMQVFDAPVPLSEGDNGLLSIPVTVELKDKNGVDFVPNQKVVIGEEFEIIYNYGDIQPGLIDKDVEYILPELVSGMGVAVGESSGTIVELPVSTDTVPATLMGMLRYNRTTGAMTFQFDELFHEAGVLNFFLRFSAMLNGDGVESGDVVDLSFPTINGTVNFPIVAMDGEKDPPTINKSGVLSGTSVNDGSTEILWSVTVTNGENPNPSISIHDKWSENQAYIDGSFCVNGVPVTTGLSLSESGYEYLISDITAEQTDTITYKTSIKSSAFLNKNGVPLTSGNIKCTNDAEVFFPGEDGQPMDVMDEASYSHPITWLYKTSGKVLNRDTGEMEWTVTIYNNGLNMINTVLYDRLSPGVSVIGNTAAIYRNGTHITDVAFSRLDGEDRIYGSNSAQVYNSTCDLGTVGSVTQVIYRTQITNPAEYNAAAYFPPDSIFDNKAFVKYQLPTGEGLGSEVGSPVVSKSGGYDQGLIGKTGTIEPAYHTIKWSMTINQNSESLTDVIISDAITPADAVSAQPTTARFCRHVYDDLAERNQPQYTYDNKTYKDFTLTTADTLTVPFTYKLKPKADGSVYDIEFFLGSINKPITIVYRSTVTDEAIYANNVTSNNCKYENKVMLSTLNGAFSYATASVVYKSNVFQKSDPRSWQNKRIHAYQFDENQFPWIMTINTNKMEMTGIHISDTLAEGTSLVDGKILVGSLTPQINYWFKLFGSGLETFIPEGSTGDTPPYYTYDAAERKLDIYLEDITGDAVGTDEARKTLVFIVQVDVDSPAFAKKTASWSIGNTGVISNNYLKGDRAVSDGAEYVIEAQHVGKSGNPYNNGGAYSIDYSLSINRIQQTLPATTVITDTIPDGLRLDLSSVKLYEASVISTTDFKTLDDGTNGSLQKEAEVDPTLFTVEASVSSDGVTTMQATLPQNSGNKMFILDYTCDVVNISKAPFTNNAKMEGVNYSNASNTITRVDLNGASGGGTLMNVKKTAAYLTKTDSETNLPIEGAEFGIYYKGSLIERKQTDANGEICFEDLNENLSYTVIELNPAPGYLAAAEGAAVFTATAEPDVVRLAFTNTPVKGSVRFTKTDADGKTLAGAQFGVWTTIAGVTTDAPFATSTSTENGAVTFTGLTAGETYYISEISAPEGFIKSNEIIAAKMNNSGEQEKLWLISDTAETGITSIQNEPSITSTPTGSLSVSKTVTGAGDKDKLFTFTFTFNNAGVYTYTGSKSGSITNGGTIQLKHGESVTISDLPAGTEYTVAESENEGYLVTSEGETGRIEENQVSETKFMNYMEYPLVTGVNISFGPWVCMLLIAIAGILVKSMNTKRRKHCTD